MKLSKQAGALWAKKQSKDGQQAWLPLIVHLIDTKNTINWLFNHWLSAGQRQLLQGTLSEAEAQQLVELVGFIHDIGKATPAFQTKKSYDRDDELDDQLKAQLAYSGFLDLDKLCLASPNKSLHARAGEVIVDELGLPTAIGAIIGGHHGKPESSRPFEQLEAYTANYFQSDNDPELQAPWRQVQKDLFDTGLASAGYHSATEVPTIKQPQAVILEGVLIMADWLASSEYLDYEQTIPLFPLIPLNQSWQSINLTTRFQAAISAWDLSDEWDPQRVQLEHAYQQRWGYEPRPVQKVMTAAIGALTDPGMVIVEAPMGLGKTEIALIAAEELAYRTGSDGVFIGLPTQATTNAMFERVDDWLRFLAQQQDKNLAIKLMHSKSQFNQTYRELPHAANIYMAEDDAGAVVVNDWFAGKKSILTKFTVGTIDNLLLMGLKQKHLFLRHLGFSGKVVIIDEVHAYDIYMDQYLYKAISWLGAYHVPIVILSATLPKAKRKALLEAYLVGKYGRKYKKQLVAPANWAETQAYPLLSMLDGCEIKQVEDFPGQSDQPPMKVQVKQLIGSDEELMSQVTAKIAAGGVAGVIVNTVKRAQTLAQLVPADIKLMVLHSAFLATDRTAQETALQAAIGKQGDRPTKLIVIGTQVLEQSLDIDFDVLYTDIAPMDLILQRVGRLHRHQIERPQALKVPQVFIMGIQDQNDYGAGNEAVYGKYLLMKTAHFLKNTLTLPTDISPLVQQVYDSQTDGEVADIETAKQKFDTDLAQESKKANVFQIAKPNLRAEATIHDWLGRNLGRVDQDEQKASAAVRDIKETLEVILVQQTSAGKFLLDGRPLDSVPEQVIAQQVIRLPNAVTPRIDQAIQTLETLTSHYFLGWQNNVWLKGALALPLDQNLATDFEGWHLSYTPTLGLSYIKEDEHE
ncbi:CRISPR-associated helicase/endonuclease Cas3 [Lactobacillus sp. CBA3605]|uniref:CRISPR-associated helicase/endonuclease Cas3 n=1 Tax=Lactobacillus sp. CBA3605 TaxID=2099788 RepID=UPI000CFB214F|nr:CRISPR-associated helicase/endonuclease Cas3 [Lactobacillus sp. CBA3605]AVK61549.1 CRISPR-associated helicase/endonuclease Cas3 [Lactobacillus sp. CBA3605]